MQGEIGEPGQKGSKGDKGENVSFLVLTEGHYTFNPFVVVVNHGYFSVVLHIVISILYYLFGNYSVEIQSILLNLFLM